jgi:hypothetical protein
MQTDDGPESASHQPIGLGARIVGILTSPRQTFERAMADPRWIGVLALSVVGVATLSSALMSTDFAQRAVIEQQVTSMEAFGVTMTDEVYAELEQGGQFAAYTTFGFTLIGVPVFCVALAGMLYGAGYGLLGSAASFGQVLAVVAHAGVVFLAQQLFVVPLNYAREAITPPSTLAAFTPMLDEGTFAVNLLSAVDLFHVWWIMVLSIGLAVAWKRRTARVATALYAIYAGIVLVIAVLRTTLGF